MDLLSQAASCANLSKNNNDVTATIVRASWNFRKHPRRWEKIQKKLLQQDTEILHVSCIMWRRMRIWLTGKTHDGRLFRNDWKVLKKCLCFSAAKIQIFLRDGLLWLKRHGSSSDKRPCQWFGWFFNNYMAGSDSCLTGGFLPVFDLVLSTIFLIMFSLYFIFPCQQTCFHYQQQSLF